MWARYRALLASDAPSPADGVMCAMSSLNGVPSCVDPLLLNTTLREAWQSDAIIQTDCCDSVGSVASFLKIPKAEALAMYVNAGGGAYYGFEGGNYRPELLAALANGTVHNSTIRAVGNRVLETEMRLGFFDAHRPE